MTEKDYNDLQYFEALRQSYDGDDYEVYKTIHSSVNNLRERLNLPTYQVLRIEKHFDV